MTSSETAGTNVPVTKLCCNPFGGDRFSFNGCQNRGTQRCSGCSGAKPETIYCSVECQKQDWRFHKAYCGKKVYTFELELLNSSNPVITRVFDVPAWFTFRQLHYTIQYAMGPWQCTHLHEFTFEAPSPEKRSRFSHRNVVLKIGDEKDDSDKKSLLEQDVFLQDVFTAKGGLHRIVAPQGEVFPLYYLYDFGDNWDHKLVFKGEKLARADRPLFSAATGCGPVEDSGAIEGWEDVKAAFGARRPTKEQRERRDWARNVSGLGDKFDPFKEPDVKIMNYEGRWENHLHGFMEMMGEPVPEIEDDDEHVLLM